jgi:hypothetical protein
MSVVCGTAQTAAPAAARKAMVSQYCAGCHNDKLKSGGFSWTKLDLDHPEQNAEQAEHVIRKVKTGLMPPPGLPRPEPAVLRTFVTSLEESIDRAAARNPNPGRPALHRLNRIEYANSVRDLLDLDIDINAMLPPDDMSHGFDNMSDILTVSPALMEGYVRAAGKISRAAVGDMSAPAITATYQVPRTVEQRRHVDGTPWGTRGGTAVTHTFPADGDYTFRLGFYYTPDGVLFGHSQGKGQQVEVAVDGERVALFDIDINVKQADDGLVTKPVHVTAGPHKVSASFPAKSDGPLEDGYRSVEQTLVDVSLGYTPGLTSLVHLHDLSITGPRVVTGLSETPSRRKIFSCRPIPGKDEVPCARAIISRLVRQAYRRPVTEHDTEGLLGFFQQGRNGGDFDSGIRTAIQALLSSPDFVFRPERVPVGVSAGSSYKISDLELASRLSFFLWSSHADDELLTVASANKLRDPGMLEKQVRRMLADPRAASLSTHFARQWLHLQNLDDVSPDPYIYQNFDKTLAASMQQETELLFGSLIREDRNLINILNADYTFVNERLAKHYGIPNVVGNTFRKVPVTDPNRQGLLGQGSILTLTSIANRTSPVQRGKYVMEVVLGTPPPPPPPDVPPLKENAEGEKAMSVRERMEMHRANEPCRSCHKMMDPIGLALENYDGIGVWRRNDSGVKIDATGELFDGSKLDGPLSLRQAILKHSDAFIGSFTESLLAYGMGRVLEPFDMPAVRAIEKDAAKHDNRMSAFIIGVVNSAPFQMRRVDPPPAPSAGGN